MRPTKYRKYTKEEMRYLKEHCHDRPEDVAEFLGAPIGTINEYMRKLRRGVRLRRTRTPGNYYALYSRKTDELVCSGSAEECAESLGIRRNTFYSMVSKSRKGTVRKWDVYVEPYSDALVT